MQTFLQSVWEFQTVLLVKKRQRETSHQSPKWKRMPTTIKLKQLYWPHCSHLGRVVEQYLIRRDWERIIMDFAYLNQGIECSAICKLQDVTTYKTLKREGRMQQQSRNPDLSSLNLRIWLARQNTGNQPIVSSTVDSRKL